MGRRLKVYSKNDMLWQLGEELAKLRIQAGLNQAEASDLLGLQTNSVSLYERGKTCTPIHTLYNMSRLYGFSIDNLLQKVVEK